MWGDIAIGGGVLSVVGVALRWQQRNNDRRITKIEKDQTKALYQDNGQTNYTPRSECIKVQETFCKKIDEVKNLIISSDEKREETKDEDHKAHQMIGERLAAIEAKLP